MRQQSFIFYFILGVPLNNDRPILASSSPPLPTQCSTCRFIIGTMTVLLLTGLGTNVGPIGPVCLSMSESQLHTKQAHLLWSQSQSFGPTKIILFFFICFWRKLDEKYVFFNIYLYFFYLENSINHKK